MGRRKRGLIKVLQIDGGGIRGIIPISVCRVIEDATGSSLCNDFSLMYGTSTGSIISGMLSNGTPAEIIYDIYVNCGDTLFKRYPWYKRIFGGVKYDRINILNLMRDMIDKYGRGPFLRDLRCDFVSTSFNRISGRTHFQMSWDNYHGKLGITDVISWSALSAAYYFGPVIVPTYKYDVWYQRDNPKRVQGAVFFDGGQGRNNCTLLECLITCMKRGWLNNPKFQVEILSLGCGSPRLYNPDDSKRYVLSDLKDYVTQSRDEAVHDQMNKSRSIEKSVNNLHIHRLDSVIKDEENSLDALKYTDNFIKYGDDLSRKIPDIFISG